MFNHRIPLLFILLALFSEPFVHAQNRAPSVYLNYKDNYTGDIIMNTLRVPTSAPYYTYYNSMCFGGGTDGGGYCGMQSATEGHNFIFSLWDPTSVHEAITADYIGAGTDVANFGGEGTGLRSLNYGVGWDLNQWYTLVARVWSPDTHSHYGFWVFDHNKNAWHHLVTMNYPVDELHFKGSTSAFIEDWGGNGQLSRQVHRKDGWKRRITNAWVPFTAATITRVYPDAGCANYIDNYDGGVVDSLYYFITSGGATTHPDTNVAGTTVYLPTDKTSPDFPAGEINTLIVNNYKDSLGLRWTVNPATSPQYSYTIEVFDNPDFTGTPLKASTTIKPQARSAFLRKNDLPSGTYYFRLFIHDIFDNRSNDLANSFTGINDIAVDSDIAVYPNPAADYLMITGFNGKAQISIYSITGKKIIYQQITTNSINISNLSAGVYSIKIEAEKRIAIKKFIKE